MTFEQQASMYARIEKDIRRTACPPTRDNWERRMKHEAEAKLRAKELKAKNPLAMHILKGDGEKC